VVGVTVSYERIFTTIVVSALVAMAGFSGAVSATDASSAHVSTDAQAAQQQQENSTALQIDSLLLTNLSTSMEVGNATMEIQNGTETRTVTVDSASVELSNATVEITNATLDEEGRLNVTEATVMVTEGTIEIESSQGNQTIDLSDTNRTVENRSVVLTDFANEDRSLMDGMDNVTINRMTIENVSGSAMMQTFITNVRPTEANGERSVSVAATDANVSMEGANLTLMNVTMQGDTIMIEEVRGSVDSAEVNAEEAALLVGSDLSQQEDVQRSVEDVSFTRTDVEFNVSNMSSTFEQRSEERNAP
jgi:uncharacterized cupredoxin-like copper-binding protein